MVRRIDIAALTPVIGTLRRRRTAVQRNVLRLHLAGASDDGVEAEAVALRQRLDAGAATDGGRDVFVHVSALR